MLTRRGTGLLAAAGVLWLVARSFGAAELQIAAVGALLLLLGAVTFASLSSRHVAVERVVRPATLPFGADTLVESLVSNRGRLTTTVLGLRDRTPVGFPPAPPATLSPIRPGRSVVVSHRLRASRRGHLSLGPTELTVVDPFGLARRRRLVSGTVPLTVHPPVHPLSPAVPLGGASSSGRGGRPRSTPGGEDFAEIRDYVRGDDLRTVHWSSTAHRGRLMVRQAESSETRRAVVLLDVREGRHVDSGGDATIETAVAAAASVGCHLLERGRSPVLVEGPLMGPNPVTPSREAWLDRLAGVQPGPVRFLDLLGQLRRGEAGDGVLVAILTVPDAGELEQLVRAGRSFASPRALLIAPPGRPRTAATTTTAAEALRAAGWRVGILGQGRRIEDAWLELLRVKGRQRERTGAGA